jgi:tetratricopeptide (TPR) repeat protein
MAEQVHNYRLALLCFLLAVVTFAVYLPVRNHEFVRYDDDVYVARNPNVQSGLTAQNIKWAFTASYCSYWHPLTWLSHMLDYQLFDARPGPQHLVNVFLHAANTLLLFIVLNRMTNRIWPCVFVACLFALHPLNVESVAWVAERKNVLSTLFWLLTMLAYARYAERPSIDRYLITLVLFAMGLMSKPMLVTLPFALLLLDYWPLNRLLNSQFSILNSLFEKLPFIFLSGISGIITFITAKKVGAMSDVYLVPFRERIANAIVSYLDYIGKMIWPARLAVLYPLPIGGIPAAKVALYAIILVLITALIIYHGRRRKYLLVGWLLFLGTLVPVIGIVQVGAQAMADRYTYVPLIGLFIIIAFAAADLFEKIPFRKIILTTLAGAILLACAVATSIQLKYWKNSFSLFEHTIAVTKNNYVIFNSYASVIGPLGRYEEAAKYLTEAVRIMPNFPEAHHNLGNALRNLGNFDQAIRHYNISLQLDPTYTSAHYGLGLALADKGDYDAAIEHYKICLGPDADLKQNTGAAQTADQSLNITRAGPDTPKLLSTIGSAYAQKGQYAQAVEYYKKALQIDPNFTKAREGLDAVTQKQSQH